MLRSMPFSHALVHGDKVYLQSFGGTSLGPVAMTVSDRFIVDHFPQSAST
jgi:hypothetical protein